MKAYTFIHSYIYGIQVGIQAGHSNIEIMRNLDPGNHARDKAIADWADFHKTFAWLDGGDSDTLNDAINVLQLSGAPYAFFNEPALKSPGSDVGVVTAATVILTEEEVQAADDIRRYRLVRTESEVDSTTWFESESGSIGTSPMTRQRASLVELVANSRIKGI
ncbi:hydrolase [Vibrio phage D69]